MQNAAISPLFASSCPMLSPQLLKKSADRLNAAMKVRDVELLVGSMQIVVRQSEAHHHAGDLQHVLKVGDDRNRAARPDEHRILLEGVMQRLGCRLDVLVVGANHACRTLAPHFHFSVYSLGRVLLYEGQV